MCGMSCAVKFIAFRGTLYGQALKITLFGLAFFKKKLHLCIKNWPIGSLIVPIYLIAVIVSAPVVD